ncbi:MAG: hypothetical protein CMJ62_11315, partial [Planctomycetaceae bacterium]|nr:hypothetical protein [Planctomycetaceae bacterium]
QISLASYGVGSSYSDTLSDMAADPDGDLLVALQCEQGKIAIIDGAAESVLAVVDLGGPRPNDGPGRMNAAVDLSDPANRRIFVFLADDNKLYRLEESNGFVPRLEDAAEITVEHQVQQTYGFRSVYYSPLLDKVFVWNVAVDPDTLAVETTVAGVERLVGEADGVLFAQHQAPAGFNRTESLVTVDAATFEIVHQQQLAETMAMDAKVHLDLSRDQVAFTRPAYSESHLVGIESTTTTTGVQLEHLSTQQMPLGTHRPEILATASGDMLAVVVQPGDDAAGNRVKHQVYRYDSAGNQTGDPFPVTWVTDEYGEPADHRTAIIDDELVIVYQSLVFDGNPGVGGGPAEQYALNQSLLLARYSLDGQELFRGPIVAHVTDFSEDSFPDHCLLPLEDSLLVSTGADHRIKLREVSYSGEVLGTYEIDADAARPLSSIGNSLLSNGDRVWMITGSGVSPRDPSGILVSELDAAYQPTELAWFAADGQEYTFPTGSLLHNGYTFVTYDAREMTGSYLSPQEHPFQPRLMVLDAELNRVLDMAVGSGMGFAHVHPTLDVVGDELVIGWSMRAEAEGGDHYTPQVQLERYALTFVGGGTPVPGSPQVASVVRNHGDDTFDTLETLAFTFDRDVSVSASSLLLADRTAGGTPVDLTSVTFNYRRETFTATWDFTGVAGIGAAFYTAVLDTSSVTDSQGNPLDGNADGAGGDDFSHVLLVAARGDSDVDGDVDLSDLNTLFANFKPLGTSAHGWCEGSFDNDGDVDLSDYNWLATQYAPLGYAGETPAGYVLPCSVGSTSPATDASQLLSLVADDQAYNDEIQVSAEVSSRLPRDAPPSRRAHGRTTKRHAVSTAFAQYEVDRRSVGTLAAIRVRGERGGALLTDEVDFGGKWNTPWPGR